MMLNSTYTKFFRKLLKMFVQCLMTTLIHVKKHQLEEWLAKPVKAGPGWGPGCQTHGAPSWF